MPSLAKPTSSPGGTRTIATILGKTGYYTERDAEYDARCAENGAIDADLQQLITLWPQLAASVREALLQQATESLTRGP